MRVYVIVPAAGIGTRMAMGHPAGGVLAAGGSANAAAPKQFLTIGGVPVLIHSLRAFLAAERVSAIYVAVRASEMDRMRAHIADFQLNKGGLGEKVHVVEGGENRQESVGKALAALEAEAEDVVLVHDAVRPLIDAATIDRTIDAIVKHGAAIVGLPAVDTIKQVERTADGALVTSTIPRERVVYAQTPQGARYAALKRAFDEAAADEFLGTDEASLLERAGVPVVVVAGSARNFKITQPGDLELAEFYLKEVRMSMRIGYGFDSHAFKAGVPLVIGGLKIEHDEGLAGHSDGDVLLHAITDALLGAVSAGDIGSFFPPSDPRWKDADSAIFLKTALEEIAIAGYKIVNIDTVLVLAAPKIGPISGDLRQSVADLLQVSPRDVGIKAKTPEGMNLDHVAMAHATVLLESIDLRVEPERMTAVADIETELHGALESLVGSRHDISALGRKVPGFDPDDLT